jgi:hypothetical protein
MNRSECQALQHMNDKGESMKLNKHIFIWLFVIATLPTVAMGAKVSADYDHSAKFSAYKTYSWTKVETANSIWDARVKKAVDKELAAKGWTQVPSGGDVSVVAVASTRTEQQLNTHYNGFGGRRFGGFGDATTTVDKYKVGTLVIDMFDAGSKNLIWRASASDTLSGSPEKNTKNLNKGVQKMFSHFPPSPAKG